MYKDELVLRLEELISRYLQAQGLVLVDLLYLRSGRSLTLRVLVDYPQGGIDIDTCARLNKELGAILDEQDIVPGGYILEVSSPGLDRPLKNQADFARCLDKEAVFYLASPANGRIEWQGVIKRVDQDAVLIETGGGEVLVPLASINKAKLVII